MKFSFQHNKPVTIDQDFPLPYDYSPMRPKDLKSPYCWEDRRPLLEDRVFYVPEFYDKHQACSFPDWKTIFGNDHPVIIEYGAGNGMWTAEKAQDLSQNWVAVELDFERVRKIWSKVKNLGLPNLFVISGKAQTFAKEYLPTASIDGIYINFPDPWPKDRHAKNRLFQQPFINELARTIKPGGTLIVVTDDPPYSEQICREMLAHPAWESDFPAPYYVTEWEGYGTSYFDALWREKGKVIHYFQFRRK
jgi:tRNA (guanine-N7-)-methyltransferase